MPKVGCMNGISDDSWHWMDITYVGIDPGAQGGIAMLRIEGPPLVFPMPETLLEIWQLLNRIDGGFVCIESVHAMPKQGISGAFTFGRGYGALEMAILAAGLSSEAVTPQRWQKAMGISPRKKGKTEETKLQFKKRMKAMAQRLYPTLPLWKEPKTEGKQLAISDALLIATFIQRKTEGRLG